MLNNHQMLVFQVEICSVWKWLIGGDYINSLNDINQQNKITYSRKIGSFGFKANSFEFYKSSNKVSFIGNTSIIRDNNKFKFKNTSVAGNPYQVNNYGNKNVNESNLNFNYKINDKHSLLANYWFNYTEEVPQNLSTTVSDAKQYDRNNRFLITSLNHFNYIKINFKQSYLKENFRYTELSKNIDSRYIAETYLTNINIKLDKQKRRFHLGSTYNFNIINNNNYINETIDENQFSIYGSAELLYNYLKLNTKIRKEWESNYYDPILPSISMEINLNNHIKL